MSEENHEPIAAPKESIKVGSIIEFGKYPYDEKGAITSIKWKVLDVNDNKALITTVDGIDCKNFNEKNKKVAWQSCTLRKWLNSEFYDNSFNDREKQQIELAEVIAHINPYEKAKQGKNTKDKVFLLSLQEVSKLFPNDEARKCVPTGYAIKHGVEQDEWNFLNGVATCSWYLRTSGYATYVTYVDNDGVPGFVGIYANMSNFALRPALWLKL